jgi:hypothetical protein
MKRNLSALGNGTAASVNAGTLGNQADKIIHLDPNSEILYDPAENIRNGKVVDDSLEGLIELRLTIEGSKQLQPIRVYPLPPHKLDPSKPALKYGIAVGHRRTLCSRLTSADHPAISDLPRKVAAVIDTEWLKRGRAYQLRCQIHENTARVDLNPVELGQALLDYKRELSAEEKRLVPQHELMEVYGLPEKTVYLLLKAAEFHPIAKEACHRKLLTDLDTMNTFDLICKANEELAQAIFDSLQVEGAPNTRALMRQARTLAESEGYRFNKETWSWPASVENAGNKPAVPAPAQAQATTAQRVLGATNTEQSTVTGGEYLSQVGAQVEDAGHSDVADNGQQLNSLSSPGATGQQKENFTEAATSRQSSEDRKSMESGQSQAPSAPLVSDEMTPPALGGAPIIMVEFKMGAEAKKVFTGELVVTKKSKAPNMGVVAYLNAQGREELVEVPLKLMNLVSINHQ